MILRSALIACSTAAFLVACGDPSNDEDGDEFVHTPGSGGGVGAATGGAPGAGGGGTVGTGGAAPGSGGSSTIPDTPPNWTVTGITTWRNDAKGAYTIFHDDTCNESVDDQLDKADPALTSRGLVASFGAIAQNCMDRDFWDELEVLLSHGHEIANHSFSHPNLAEDDVDLDQEMDQAHTILEENLSKPVTFFIFPYDSFHDGLLQRLRNLGYLGARAGERGLSSANFGDDQRLNFDVYGPGYSIYAGAEGSVCSSVESGDDWSSTSSACRAYVMNQYVEDIIATGGYGIRELHGLDGEAWEPIPLSEYEAHLDFLVQKVNQGDLWVATASDAIRYRRGRDECAGVTVAGDEIYFESAGADCQKFSTILSYEVTSMDAGVTSVSASQAGQGIDVTPLGGGAFRVNAHPGNGPVKLTAN